VSLRSLLQEQAPARGRSFDSSPAMPRNSGAAGTLSSHHTNYGLIFCVSHPFLTNLQRFFISAGSGPRVVKRPGGGAAVSTSRSAAAAAAPPPPPWRRGALEAKQLNQNSRHSQTNKKKLATFQLCGGRPSPAGPNNDGAAGTLSSHLNNFCSGAPSIPMRSSSPQASPPQAKEGHQARSPLTSTIIFLNFVLSPGLSILEQSSCIRRCE
jgi:hypothetical protein